jgi:serine protease Do
MDAMRYAKRNLYAVVVVAAAILGAGALWHRQPESSALAQVKSRETTESRETRPAGGKEKTTAKEQRGIAHAEDMAAEFRRAAREALPGMVSIETQGHVAIRGVSGNPFEEQSALRGQFQDRQHEPEARIEGRASGFVIDRAGVILTSNHVVAHADAVKLKFSDGREFIASEFKGDPRTDVAIIRIKPEGAPLHALTLGNSEAIDIGDWVLAVGSPFGLDLTVTAGIISAKGRGPGITEREDFLQTDAAINPGNSGGPLVNLHGEVIGMNSAIATRSGGYEGIGFAVPINLARWVADQLISHGAVTRAYLGVGVQAIDQAMARQFKIAVGSGVIVTHVAPESPAAAAKLEAGDVIVRLDGKPVHSPRELVGVVEQLHVGHKALVEVLRNGKDVRLEVTVKELPHEQQRPTRENSRGAQPTREREFGDLGIAVGELSPDIAHRLGYREAGGVAILAVEQGSIAAEAGLQEGMMIDKVGKHRVTTVAEFQAALKDTSLDEGILLLIRTPRGTQFVVLRKGNK